jgi:hypothetical protein
MTLQRPRNKQICSTDILIASGSPNIILITKSTYYSKHAHAFEQNQEHRGGSMQQHASTAQTSIR